MIRSIVVRDIPPDSVAAMERWYHRLHEDLTSLFIHENTGTLVELVEPVEPAHSERTDQ